MKRPTQWEDVFELPRERPDELERGLLEVGVLIESSLALHRNRSVQECLISRLNGSCADILGEARELLATAGQRVDIIHAAGPSVGEQAARLFGGEYAFGAAKEVPVRLVTLPYLLEAEELARAERACGHWSMEVRLACVPPLQALVVDDRVVLSEFGDRRVTLIRVPEIVHAIGMLFESLWSNAVPAMNGSIIFDCPRRSVLARRILSALHAGVPDEVAARELNVSVRTYGRYVAEIMWALGASSRFQAGVRAAKAGLLVPTSVTAPEGRAVPRSVSR